MRRHVVVDGSNIATEGRSTPSLAQLDKAVREFMQENPEVTITVVVDATFGHRIDPSEQRAFDEAEANAELVSPPAGAIGRGDAFVLRIADKVAGTILSNDSFQEFHGEYDWLFDEGRLVGGKPVPGVGWVFTLRTPVRGPKSREAVKEAKRKKAKERGDGGGEAGLELAAKAREAKPKSKRQVDRAIEVATSEVVEPDSPKANRRRRRRSVAPPAEPLNDPATFFDFVSANRPGSRVEGEVDAFTSHGAFVTVGNARCYIPLSAMADPAPRAAKEVLKRGETREFVIQALDPPRRGIELALPEVAHVAGAPTEETVDAEIHARPRAVKKAAAKRTRKRVAPAAPVTEAAPAAAPKQEMLAVIAGSDEAVRPAKRTRKAAAAKKVAPEPAAPAKVAAAKSATPAKRARKAVAKAASAEVVDPAEAKRQSRSLAAKKAAATRAAKKAAGASQS